MLVHMLVRVWWLAVWVLAQHFTNLARFHAVETYHMLVRVWWFVYWLAVCVVLVGSLCCTGWQFVLYWLAVCCTGWLL